MSVHTLRERTVRITDQQGDIQEANLFSWAYQPHSWCKSPRVAQHKADAQLAWLSFNDGLVILGSPYSGVKSLHGSVVYKDVTNHTWNDRDEEYMDAAREGSFPGTPVGFASVEDGKLSIVTELPWWSVGATNMRYRWVVKGGVVVESKRGVI